ncbi:serine hydrolase [Paraglaciecola sp.]|uniref:serine hydrolase domain-containing protein n=1 Tax=Paraglaciecola sp. TaxID=1920173 RepID=UPI0030F4861E
MKNRLTAIEMVKLKFKKRFTLILLSGFCSLAIAQNNQNAIAAKYIAPEATAAEAELSFGDIPSLEQAFINIAPADRNDGLVVGQLSDDGRNKDMIVKLAHEIAASKHGNYDSLLIAHKDKLLFESYYLRGRINLPHPQASAVKAYTSLALGRAIQMGYLSIADLDKPLVSFLKDLNPTKFVDGAEKITLHKALTMHGGLSVSSEKWEELEKNPTVLQGQGLVQTLLEHSGPITTESQTYLYGNFNPMLVMTVIDAVVPGTAEDFIKNEILDKLNITNYSWDTHVSGLPQAGWMVSITSRDMLKLGSLVLNKGKWQGEQLISADYLAKATSGLVKPTQDWIPDTYRYGYFWYQAPIAVGDKSYNATFAWGGGGQRVIVVDELDLTIAITGYDREDQIMAQIADAVLPVFAK